MYRGMTMGKRKRRIAVGMSGEACSGVVRWVVVVGRMPRTLWQVV